LARIRPYRATDASRCCDIIRACVPQLDGLNDDARAFLMDKLIPEQLNTELSALETFVFDDEDRVVGLAALAGDEAKRLYVDPAHQGQGVGRLLFAHIEARARALGLTQLRGEASPSAAGFYEQLGFLVEGPSEFRRESALFRMTKIWKAL
jgi:GNAT superfamily N-acetyltransferase